MPSRRMLCADIALGVFVCAVNTACLHELAGSGILTSRGVCVVYMYMWCMCGV
jgi:hypothetical protein